MLTWKGVSMSKLIYKEKKGEKRIIYIGGLKFTYKSKKKYPEFFTVTEAVPLLERAFKNVDVYDAKLLDADEKDIYYYLFENIFYDKENITKIQREYLQFVPKNSNNFFLDAGCGRGEFLEILKENNIKAKGIEINSLEVKLLANKGYDIEKSDVLCYLRNSSESFSGISAIQVVEHLTFDYLYEFLHLAYEKIENGGVIILETLNPQNVEYLKYFHTDLTHIRPIPDLSLQFLCEKAGFKNIKICRNLPNKGGYVNYAIVGEKHL